MAHQHPPPERMADIMVSLKSGKSENEVSHDERVNTLNCRTCKAIKDVLLVMHNPTRARMIELAQLMAPYMYG